MQILVNNVKEALFALLSLCGELPCDIMIRGVSAATIRNNISSCKTSGLITIDKKENRMRIHAPKGLEYLESLSGELYQHYMMITNGHKFRSEPRNKEIQKLFSHTVLFMLGRGYEIDNIEIKYQANHFGLNTGSDILESVIAESSILDLGESMFSENGDIIPLEESIKHISGRSFYTSRYIKYGFPVTHRINFSNIMGLMINKDNIYRVYRTGPEVRLKTQSEQDMNTWLCHLTGKEMIPAIILTYDPGDVIKKNKKLLGVFGKYYVITPEHSESLDILESRNWKTGLISALYGASPEKDCDGYFDGLPSWEILSCDYSKAKAADKYRLRCHFICFGWQEKIVKEITRNAQITLSILSGEQEEILFDYIKKGATK